MLYTLDGRTPILKGNNYVAPNASLIGRVCLEQGASVWFNCVLRGDTDDIVVGEGSNVQDACVLHTDAGIKLRIGSNCTIGHKVMLHGCDIGDGSLVGIGSVILNNARIGKNSIVGAGSLIPERKHFPDNVLIMGQPAKVVREIGPAEFKVLAASAEIYRANSARYTAGLQAVSESSDTADSPS